MNSVILPQAIELMEGYERQAMAEARRLREKRDASTVPVSPLARNVLHLIGVKGAIHPLRQCNCN